MNNYGQSNTPSGTFTQVSAGAWHSCGLRENGSVECWGDNQYDQSNPSPGLYLAVNAGMRHSCALSSTSTSCWGRRDDQPLEAISPPPVAGVVTDLSGGNGEGGTTPNPPAPTPTPAPTPATFTAVSAGSAHTCGLKTDGTIACWGNSASNRLMAPPP